MNEPTKLNYRPGAELLLVLGVLFVPLAIIAKWIW